MSRQAVALSQEQEDKIFQILHHDCKNDPLLFVQRAFDWGFGDLKGINGPEDWQRDYLIDIRDRIKARGEFDGVNSVQPILLAVASGHGIGKSTMVAWLILWLMSTRNYISGTVTATTLPQLETKTWPELAKWWGRSLNKHWFEWVGGRNTLKFYAAGDETTNKRWMVTGQTCREENSESFQGQHERQGTSFYIFDEASAIPAKIWEVSTFGLSDGEPFWFVFGNPTRNSGEFYKIFHETNNWVKRKIDSREVSIANPEFMQGEVEKYGEDSDYARVRVKGEFPRAGSMQFIPVDLVEMATDPDREPTKDTAAPLVMGVDIARFGEDSSVICFRKGRDARSMRWQDYSGLDTMQMSARVAALIDTHKPRIAFVDGAGIGGGVIDRLKQLGYRNVVDVNFGRKAIDSSQFMNVKSECWQRMKDWLDTGLIPTTNITLRDDLMGIQYSFDKANRLKLESKEDMKKRGLKSPDWAEALALTFASEVARDDTWWEKRKKRNRAKTDYRIFG